MFNKFLKLVLRPDNTVAHRFSYLVRFARVDKKCKILDLIPYLIYSLFKNSTYRNNLLLMFRISRLPVKIIKTKKNELPEIEIMINSIQKDFPLLNSIIKYAVANSENKVVEVKVIVPPDQLDFCRSFISIDTCKVVLLSENQFLNDSIRDKIKKYFPDRYGWVLQQLITLDVVINSKLSGVLQVNCDTFLLRSNKWLDFDHKQPIFCSPEYHKPYYLLLNKLNPLFKIKADSHVTHHMLFQPIYLQKILIKCGISNLNQLLDFALENCENDPSAMCLEFELYAQGMLTYFNDNIHVLKFGNVSCYRNNEITNLDFEKSLNKLSKKYNSVSFHSYQALN